MSGINSIVGLNKVDLDYRPEIKNPTAMNGADKVQNGANDNIINANVESVQEVLPPKKGECRSVLHLPAHDEKRRETRLQARA